MGADYVGLKDRVFSQKAAMNWPTEFSTVTNRFLQLPQYIPQFYCSCEKHNVGKTSLLQTLNFTLSLKLSIKSHIF